MLGSVITGVTVMLAIAVWGAANAMRGVREERAGFHSDSPSWGLRRVQRRCERRTVIILFVGFGLNALLAIVEAMF